MNILAFDSGIHRTGYAIFDKREKDYSLVTYGCITTPKEDDIQKRLYSLVSEVESLIERYKPTCLVFEELFFNINKKTVIMVAQAQGAILYVAGKNNMSIDFISPLKIKQTLTGYGLSDKKNVQKMVVMLLGLKKVPEPDDVADAIACGLAFCTIKKFT